jgi:hypothetical protein
MSENLPIPPRTAWRDAKGRITHTGSTLAVTATSGDRVWDVSRDVPMLRRHSQRQREGADNLPHTALTHT